MSSSKVAAGERGGVTRHRRRAAKALGEVEIKRRGKRPSSINLETGNGRGTAESKHTGPKKDTVSRRQVQRGYRVASD